MKLFIEREEKKNKLLFAKLNRHFMKLRWRLWRRTVLKSICVLKQLIFEICVEALFFRSSFDI